ncbi:hypothetical protein BN1058_01229 [Paraliobacillus sp. PM-2]|uniref:hypothetical protein n=1 Tax=Paraliobacillus sp. PM-2 TaxID=1462524 RepID=UPI00061C5DBB|nr:hypothetical protein [Paraliobacillus sp. PM-2]CQR46942.1 hypothetical protein BN1058_01229 [Paraliobacillus sp. PM-2]
MRKTNKQSISQQNSSIFGVDFHQFMELESNQNSLEIAEELGISTEDVQKLKENLKRS